MLRTGETVFLCKSYVFIYFILMLFIDILLCFMQIYVFLIHVLENLRMSFFLSTQLWILIFLCTLKELLCSVSLLWSTSSFSKLWFKVWNTWFVCCITDLKMSCFVLLCFKRKLFFFFFSFLSTKVLSFFSAQRKDLLCSVVFIVLVEYIVSQNYDLMFKALGLYITHDLSSYNIIIIFFFKVESDNFRAVIILFYFIFFTMLLHFTIGPVCSSFSIENKWHFHK